MQEKLEMKLEPKTANDIVQSLKDVVNHQINLFNDEGVIIASSDEKRIGTTHAGALEAIKTKEPILIEYDNQYRGAKKGLNIPILFNDTVVATIGISGERTEVEQYGNIIKKMAEILLRENGDRITSFNHMLNINNLCSLLITQPFNDISTNYLASLLRYDLYRDHKIIYIKPLYRKNSEIVNFDHLSSRLSPFIRYSSNSFYTIINGDILLFIDNDEINNVDDISKFIQTELSNALNTEIIIGIGESANKPEDYYNSYLESKIAVNWAEYNHEHTIVHYSKLDYALVITSVPPREATQLINVIFKTIPDEEIESMFETFQTYEDNNGSITHGANSLFIHKNTFQNRLNKIYQSTGFNPRELKDFVILNIGFALWNYYRKTTLPINSDNVILT